MTVTPMGRADLVYGSASDADLLRRYHEDGDVRARQSLRERNILHMRFFLGLTQSEIAERIGISQMHVSRLIRQSIDQVREQLDSAEEAPQPTRAKGCRSRRRRRGSARRGRAGRAKHEASRGRSA